MRQLGAGLLLVLGLVALSLLTTSGQALTDTGAAQQATNISSTSGDSTHPALAVVSGIRHAAWQEDDGQVYVATDETAGWEASPFILGQSPALAAGPDGTVHLVFVADDGTGNLEVYYSRYTDAGWSAPTNVSHTSGPSTAPDVAVASDGTVHFVWSDTTPGEPTLYHGWRLGSQRGAAPVLDARGTAPAVAIDPSDRVHLVWQEPDDHTGLGDVYHIYADGAGGREWSFAENVSFSPDVESQAPDVIIGPNDEVHVVWIESNVVQVRSGTPMSLGPAVVLSEAGVVGSPRLGVDTAGNVFAVWTENNQRVQAGVRWLNAPGWESGQTVAGELSGLGDVAVSAGAEATLHLAWSALPSGGTEHDIYAFTALMGGSTPTPTATLTPTLTATSPAATPTATLTPAHWIYLPLVRVSGGAEALGVR